MNSLPATAQPTEARLPPLENGERLDQKTFHARYEAMPEGIRAELFVARPDRMKCAGCDFRQLCPSAAV